MGKLTEKEMQVAAFTMTDTAERVDAVLNGDKKQGADNEKGFILITFSKNKTFAEIRNISGDLQAISSVARGDKNLAYIIHKLADSFASDDQDQWPEVALPKGGNA